MSDTLRKGWLTTRDGELYAPATLVENVYTRSGKPYDERVREYIQQLNGSSNSKIADLISKVNNLQETNVNLQNKLKNFDGSDSNSLYIIDNNERVIMSVTEAGVKSTEFTIATTGKTPISLTDAYNQAKTANDNLASLQTAIEDRLKNFDGSDSDKFFFIDNSDRIIAYIDNDGIHSTEVSANVFNSTDGRTELFITDNNENVIAYIDKDGVHSLNFLIQDNTGIVHNVKTVLENLQANLSNLETSMGSKIDAEVKARQEGDQALNTRLIPVEAWQDEWDEKSNVSFDENRIYFIDKNNNTIAYIDDSGLTVTNIHIKTPVVPSGSTANATGQDRSSMVFYQAKGDLISVVDTILK